MKKRPVVGDMVSRSAEMDLCMVSEMSIKGLRVKHRNEKKTKRGNSESALEEQGIFTLHKAGTSFPALIITHL